VKRADGTLFYPDYAEGLTGIPTEFAFGTSRDNMPEVMAKAGFKHIRTMINWWPSHAYEKAPMNMFWWKNPNPTRPQEITDVKPHSWMWKYSDDYPNFGVDDTQGTGCGVKIGHLPLRAYQWYHYFTLMRLPLTKNLTEVQKTWLKYRSFKFLDEGSISSYWVNGFEPEKYTVDKEIRFWKKHDPNRQYYHAIQLKSNGELYYKVHGYQPQH
jgi:hypothetical protein